MFFDSQNFCNSQNVNEIEALSLLFLCVLFALSRLLSRVACLAAEVGLEIRGLGGWALD
jgi:hypothetical protein